MSKIKGDIKTAYLKASNCDYASQIPDGNHNVAVYMRVGAPSDNSVCSYEILEAPFKNFISEHPTWTLVGIYRDTDNNHSKLDQLISDCQNKQIDLILTKNISRLSRDLTGIVETVKLLSASEIGIFFMDEDLYSLNPKSDLYINLFKILAEEESKAKSIHPHSSNCRYYPNP